MREHKGQNSTGTRCRGFLILESWCLGFLVLESRCRGFLFLWKNALESPCCGLFVSVSRCRGFLVLESRCCGFLVLESWCLVFSVLESRCCDSLVLESRCRDFWSWNLDVVVYVPPRPRFRYHRENKNVTHNLQLCCWKMFHLPKFMQHLSA